MRRVSYVGEVVVFCGLLGHDDQRVTPLCRVGDFGDDTISQEFLQLLLGLVSPGEWYRAGSGDGVRLGVIVEHDLHWPADHLSKWTLDVEHLGEGVLQHVQVLVLDLVGRFAVLWVPGWIFRSSCR